MPVILGGAHQLVGLLVLADGMLVVLCLLIERPEVGMAQGDAQRVVILLIELHGETVVVPC